jgi:RNA polymerase sigma factor (sigma-70 family)
MRVSAATDEADLRWRQLMHAAQAGDSASYEQLLREVLPFLRAIIVRRCGARCELEEILQETLLTVHRVRHTYDSRRPFKPWAAAIAERRGLDALRRRGRIDRYEQSDDGSAETFADPAANSELEALGSEAELNALLDQLPARQRQALEATKLKELSLIEAAESSGQSVGALKVNTHRALRALRRIVQKP